MTSSGMFDVSEMYTTDSWMMKPMQMKSSFLGVDAPVPDSGVDTLDPDSGVPGIADAYGLEFSNWAGRIASGGGHRAGFAPQKPWFTVG